MKVRYTAVREMELTYSEEAYGPIPEGMTEEEYMFSIDKNAAYEAITGGFEDGEQTNFSSGDENTVMYPEGFSVTAQIINDHTSEEDILQYFSYDHLKEPLRSVSKQFAEMANNVIMELPRCPQRTIALNKLMECKDAAVRASFWKPQAPKLLAQTKVS